MDECGLHAEHRHGRRIDGAPFDAGPGRGPYQGVYPNAVPGLPYPNPAPGIPYYPGPGSPRTDLPSPAPNYGGYGYHTSLPNTVMKGGFNAVSPTSSWHTTPQKREKEETEDVMLDPLTLKPTGTKFGPSLGIYEGTKTSQGSFLGSFTDTPFAIPTRHFETLPEEEISEEAPFFAFRFQTHMEFWSGLSWFIPDRWSISAWLSDQVFLGMGHPKPTFIVIEAKQSNLQSQVNEFVGGLQMFIPFMTQISATVNRVNKTILPAIEIVAYNQQKLCREPLETDIPVALGIINKLAPATVTLATGPASFSEYTGWNYGF